ncbi:hypothetical protein PISMIDRAFT_680872 [Pisolithus microcarpus 441]|uniref:Uncharacterized protein n=1 Tax=Pisolithus microcarpus 441 TaxID=765257 RepID=A0A0C9YYR1_9AGAM|nr:hypothetical protein PISMIDRAFT_680872 [Pisolithus microcarpus 441]
MTPLSGVDIHSNNLTKLFVYLYKPTTSFTIITTNSRRHVIPSVSKQIGGNPVLL